MEEQLIGRHNESRFLTQYLHSDRSEFIAIYGRRRVGKTFLVRKTIGDEFCFKMTGMENVNQQEQLLNFYMGLRRVYSAATKCDNWLEAFDQLERYLESLPQGNKIVFIDELPWLDTAKSDFVSSLEHFWNDWASARQDIKLVTCGSAASWMIDNLINNHGGLHNRVTHQMLIEPFTLSECKEYFDAYGFGYGMREIVESYMVFGGVPYYLSLLKSEESVAQNVDRLLFSATGELRTEKDNLFRSLFKHSADYMLIMEALSSKGKGLTRDEIISATKLHNNARFTKMMQELENCRFVRRYQAFDKKARMTMFQLVDPFVHFCYQIQDKCSFQDENYWSHSINTPAYNAWSGFAFEMLCLNHVNEIKRALNIGGVQTAVYCWRTPTSAERGAQIDLLIDRADHCVNLCELKFSIGEYVMSKSEREKIQNRMDSFIIHTKTKKSIRVTLITSFGCRRNVNSGIAVNQLTIADLL